MLQQRDAQCEKEQFTNKGRDTLLNSYTKNKFKATYYQLQDRGSSILLEYYFYILINILLGYYILTYSSNRYSTKILDLFTFKFKGKGPIYYMLLIFTTYIGKQNQYSYLKTIRALQNKRLLIYILSSLIFYLLYYQDLSNKLFLDFSKYLVQYNIYLIKSSTRDYKVAFLYNLQQEQVIKVFQYISIFLQKKTYIRQSTSTKIVELKGVYKEQIQHTRRQNQEQIVGYYLSSLL